MSSSGTTGHSHLPHLMAFQDEPIVFLTACTHGRQAVLAHARAHDALRRVWGASLRMNGWCVGHYVLMPDHLHLFARPARTASPMAKWIQAWKSVTSRDIARELGLRPPVWQRDYFDRYLRSSDNYSEKWHYVRSNPVRAGLVKKPEDWPYWGKIEDIVF